MLAATRRKPEISQNTTDTTIQQYVVPISTRCVANEYKLLSNLCYLRCDMAVDMCMQYVLKVHKIRFTIIVSVC